MTNDSSKDLGLTEGDGDGELPGAPASSESMARSHVRGSSLLLFGRLLSLGFTLATQILLVRSLSKEEFGVIAYALALASAGRLLLSLGQGQSISKFAAEYEESKDYGRLFGSIIMAFGTIVVTCLLAAAVLLLGADRLLVQGSGIPGELAIILVLLLLGPLEALDQVVTALLASFSRAGSIFFRKYILTPGLRLLVVVLLLVLGAGAGFLAAGYVLASILGLGVYIYLLLGTFRARGLAHHFHWREVIFPWREISKFTSVTLASETVFLMINTVSVMILASRYSAVQVAEYRAVIPAAKLNQLVYASFTFMFLPLMSRLRQRDDRAGAREAYWSTATFIAVLSFPVAAMTIPFAEVTTVTLFGEDYRSSAIVLALVSVGYYFNSALGFNAITLQVFDRLKYALAVNVSAAVLNLVLTLVLTLYWGVLGVAIAVLSTLVAQNVLNQWGLRGAIATSLVVRSTWPVYGAILAGLALLAGVHFAWHPGVLVAAAASSAIWLCLLLALRQRLAILDLFPEAGRIPLIGRLF